MEEIELNYLKSLLDRGFEVSRECFNIYKSKKYYVFDGEDIDGVELTFSTSDWVKFSNRFKVVFMSVGGV
ncbi:MAG: hypothetical protein ACRC0F_09350 [Cetobacterium sp.]